MTTVIPYSGAMLSGISYATPAYYYYPKVDTGGSSYITPIYSMSSGSYVWPTPKNFTKFIALVMNNLPGFVLIQNDHVRNRCTVIKKLEALKALYIVYEHLGYKTTTDIIHVRDLQYTDNEFSLTIKPAICSEEILEELSITQPDLQNLLAETFGV